MNREPAPRPGSSARFAACTVAASLLWLAGCAALPGAHKQVKMEEGPAAAQRQALAKAQSPGTSGSGTTTAPIPSLTSGPGEVRVPGAPPPAATAPSGDDFDEDNAAHLLARCHDRAARQEWVNAVGDCRRSWDLDRSSIEAQVELMRLLVTLQSYSEAEVSARAVLAVKPSDPVALYYLAWSFRGRDEFPRAIETLQKAVAADPGREEFVEALAKTYRLAGNYGKCFETLARALNRKPGDEAILSMVSAARSELNEKLWPYYKLVKTDPASYKHHAALAFMLQKYGMPQKAVAVYETALAKSPSPLSDQSLETRQAVAQIYYNRGLVYRDLGRSELAEPAFSEAMQVDPSLAPQSWYFIGLCRSDLGKFEASIEALRKSIELAPDVADAHQALGDAGEKAGKADLAAEQREAAAAIRTRRAAEQEAAASQAPAPAALP